LADGIVDALRRDRPVSGRVDYDIDPEGDLGDRVFALDPEREPYGVFAARPSRNMAHADHEHSGIHPPRVGMGRSGAIVPSVLPQAFVNSRVNGVKRLDSAIVLRKEDFLKYSYGHAGRTKENHLTGRTFHSWGFDELTRRGDRVIRPGSARKRRRIVIATRGPVIAIPKAPTQRMRLCAIVASTAQAPFAEKLFDGECASPPSFRSLIANRRRRDGGGRRRGSRRHRPGR
jgi:hypothetical protein